MCRRDRSREQDRHRAGDATVELRIDETPFAVQERDLDDGYTVPSERLVDLLLGHRRAAVGVVENLVDVFVVDDQQAAKVALLAATEREEVHAIVVCTDLLSLFRRG